MPWEDTPDFLKPAQRKSFRKCWWRVRGIFQGYVGEILELLCIHFIYLQTSRISTVLIGTKPKFVHVWAITHYKKKSHKNRYDAMYFQGLRICDCNTVYVYTCKASTVHVSSLMAHERYCRDLGNEKKWRNQTCQDVIKHGYIYFGWRSGFFLLFPFIVVSNIQHHLARFLGSSSKRAKPSWKKTGSHDKVKFHPPK